MDRPIQIDMFMDTPSVVEDGKEVFFLQGMRTIPSGRHVRLAEIEIKQNAVGLWMWACSCYGKKGGFCYGVSEKWGNFALSRTEALTKATIELARRASKSLTYDEQDRVRNWLGGLF